MAHNTIKKPVEDEILDDKNMKREGFEPSIRL